MVVVVVVSEAAPNLVLPETNTLWESRHRNGSLEMNNHCLKAVGVLPHVSTQSF